MLSLPTAKSLNRLYMLKPDLDDYAVSKQAEQKIAHDLRAQDREFLSQSVMVRN